MIKIYTDGSCIGNPGKGGWAAIIFKNNEKKILKGSKDITTNNQKLRFRLRGVKINSRSEVIKNRIQNQPSSQNRAN